jgi:hypothetical protein
MGQWLYYPPKEGMLQIFIALKNPSPSAGIIPMILPSNGKHASHYTNEDDFITLKNPLSLAGFEPVNFGSNGKYTGH